MGHRVVKGFSGMKVKEMCGCVEGFDPVRRGKMGLNEKGTQNVIDGANGSFGFAVLLRGVRAGESKLNTMS